MTGQQAIGVTVNFVNRGTMEELTIEEISGIAFIYNQVTFLYLSVSNNLRYIQIQGTSRAVYFISPRVPASGGLYIYIAWSCALTG